MGLTIWLNHLVMAEIGSYSETEERILAAALDVFASKGQDGARMQEIADAAGINKALLHYYFRNKAQLYEQVFDYVFRRFLGAFGTVMRETATFEDFLHAFIDGYIDFVREHLAVVKLITSEHLAGGAVMGRRLKHYMETSEAAPPRLFVERLREAIARGEVRPVDPYQTLLTTISGCIFFFLMFPTVCTVLPAARADADAFIAARKAHLFEILYQGLRAPTP